MCLQNVLHIHIRTGRKWFLKIEVSQTVLDCFIFFISQSATSQSIAVGCTWEQVLNIVSSWSVPLSHQEDPAETVTVWMLQWLRFLSNPFVITGAMVIRSIPTRPHAGHCEGPSAWRVSSAPSSPTMSQLGPTSPMCQVSASSKNFYSPKEQREQWNSHPECCPPRRQSRRGVDEKGRGLLRWFSPTDHPLWSPSHSLSLSLPCRNPLTQRTNIPPNLGTGKT